MKLYQYAIIWHPTDKQATDEGTKSKKVKDITSVLARDENQVLMMAAAEIPAEFKDQMDQLQIPVRPF